MFGIISTLKYYLKRERERRKWNKYYDEYRARNRDNFTQPVNFFDLNSVSIGKKTYGGIKVLTSNISSKLKIGCYCSIAPDVTFIPCLDHYVNHISTYPFKVMVMHEKSEAISKGDIIIDDDVWIGYGATILSGVHIGQGAIVAAGAVVSRDFPPYSMGGGYQLKY